MTAFISAWSKDIVTGCNGAGGDGGGCGMMVLGE